METAFQENKTASYPRKWLVVLIWILSTIATLSEAVVVSMAAWLRISGRGGGNLGLGLQFRAIFLMFVAFWGTAIPATGLLIGLWSSVRAPLKAKRSGTIAVALAWLGMLIVFKLH